MRRHLTRVRQPSPEPPRPACEPETSSGAGDDVIREHHYRQCGLQDVLLVNGFTIGKTRFGPAVAIDDLDGLHRAIGAFLVRERKALDGAEIRFLRRELGQSREALGRDLGKAGRTVARWENGAHRIDGTADRLLRVLYQLKSGSAWREVEPLLRRLADLDDTPRSPVRFRNTGKGWAPDG